MHPDPRVLLADVEQASEAIDASPNNDYILHLKTVQVLQGGRSHSMEQTQSSDPQVAHGVEHFPVRLADALRDLEEVKDEAREKDFPTPTDLAGKNANRLLKEMYPLSRRRFEVYPMPDGEIAIDASDGQGSSVLLLCDSDGGALCLVNMGGKHRRAKYSSAEALPDDFVREALAELEQQGD